MRKLILFIFLSMFITAYSQTYQKVTTTPTDWSGKYLIVYENSETEAYVFNGTSEDRNFVSTTLANNAIEYGNGELSAYELSITPVPNKDTYYIQIISNSKYLGRSTSANGIDINNASLENNITINNDGTVTIISLGGRKFYYFSNKFYYCLDGFSVCLYKYEESKLVSTPQITSSNGQYVIEENTEISITCATEGSTIYYTTDGSEPTTSSQQYISPFTVSENCVIKAIAVTEGLENSKIGDFNVTFVRASENELQATVVIEDVAKENGWVDKTQYLTLETNGFTLNVTPDSNGRSGKYDASDEIWRFGMKGSLDINAPTDCIMKFIYFTCLDGYNEITSSSNGELSGTLWIAENENTESVSFIMDGTAYTKIKAITIVYRNDKQTNAEEIKFIDENAQVEYYNLQGMKVANPEKGIFIKKQGAKATKVVL